MKKLILIILAAIIIVYVGLQLYKSGVSLPIQKNNAKLEYVRKNMKISSPFFVNQHQIPKQYTCDGRNVNPPLIFSEVPPETKSLALIMDDPDAPGGTWVHWVIFDMEHSVRSIDQNKKPPSGVEGMTSFGKSGYGGPCPPPLSSRRAQTSSSAPSGTHRYFFKLFALDTTLNLPESTDVKQIEDKMQGHILQRAELVGLYSRH